jgi:hypothetical protein
MGAIYAPRTTTKGRTFAIRAKERWLSSIKNGSYTEQVGAGSRPSKSTREWANVPPLERVKDEEVGN